MDPLHELAVGGAAVALSLACSREAVQFTEQMCLIKKVEGIERNNNNGGNWKREGRECNVYKDRCS